MKIPIKHPVVTTEMIDITIDTHPIVKAMHEAWLLNTAKLHASDDPKMHHSSPDDAYYRKGKIVAVYSMKGRGSDLEYEYPLSTDEKAVNTAFIKIRNL